MNKSSYANLTKVHIETWLEPLGSTGLRVVTRARRHERLIHHIILSKLHHTTAKLWVTIIRLIHYISCLIVCIIVFASRDR